MNFNPSEFAYWSLVIGGLGLFLYGITSISKVLKKISSSKLSSLITKFSGNRITGTLIGALFTAVIQSSGGTTALVIGLVRAGVMTLIQAAAIIIGANIGTSVTAFIISIPIMQYFPLVLFIGSAILLFVHKRKFENIGELIFAFGCIFFGLWIMSTSLSQLSNSQFMIDIFTFVKDYPLLGLLVGIVATICLQSSSAVIGIIQVLYGIFALTSTPLSLVGVLPMIFGSNIGTTSTALISSIGGSKESKRVALFHVFFNVFGSLLFMGLMYIPFIYDWLSTSPSWTMTPQLQLAFVHLIFNVVTAIVFLPLLGPICKLLAKIIPSDNKKTLPTIAELDKALLKSFPSQGIALAKSQVLTMFDYSKTMFETLDNYLDNPKDEDAEFIHEIEDHVDQIDRQLNEYLLQADKGNISDNDVQELTIVLKSCKDIERISDYGENLINFYANANETKTKIRSDFIRIFKEANSMCLETINKTIIILKDENKKLGLEVIQKRRDMVDYLEKIINKFFDVSFELQKEREYIDLVFVDIINSYQRVLSHCSNIAKLFGTDKIYNISESEEKHFNSLKNRY